jgi:hypothetical protein
MIQVPDSLVGPCYLPLPFECLTQVTAQTFTSMREQLAHAIEDAEAAIVLVREEYGAHLANEGDFIRLRTLQSDLCTASSVLEKGDDREGLGKSISVFLAHIEEYRDCGYEAVGTTKLLGLATRLSVVNEHRNELHLAEVREITALHAEAVTARLRSGRANVVQSAAVYAEAADDLPAVSNRSHSMRVA